MRLHISTAIAVGTAALMALATSCGRSQWKVDGTVEGGAGKSLVLEASNEMGQWYGLDTVEIAKNGRFSFSAAAAGYPEIYRLTLEGRSVYFPIDSLESIKVEAVSGPQFDSQGRISGSVSADAMQRTNDLVADAVRSLGVAGALASDSLKRRLTEEILANPSGVLAYYILNKRIDGRPIFDFSDKKDLRVLGAVANAYAEQRPSDPRTSMIRDTYLRLRRAGQSLPTDTLVAEEISLPPISLLDERGQRRDLAEVASHGKVVLLSFTAYAAPESPAYNIALADLYRANHDKGLEIYQVSVDDDEFFWRQTAQNLPWVTVYNSPADGSSLLATYNVGALPTLFLINRRGELAERIATINDLRKALPRYL